MSGGRLLPAFGLGVADPHEQQAFNVARDERAAWFDEALPLIRRLWTEDVVDHDGPRFHYEGVRVLPKPAQKPPDVWLGGNAPSELRRAGRLADGWLPSYVRPTDAEAGRVTIEQVAATHGRRIDPEHYGAIIPYATEGLPDSFAESVRRRRPDLSDPSELVADGLAAIPRHIGAFVDAGFSKFVVVPVNEGPPGDMPRQLAALADTVLPLQT
jgi:probable F420-dependent oxidoreductase